MGKAWVLAALLSLGGCGPQRSEETRSAGRPHEPSETGNVSVPTPGEPETSSSADPNLNATQLRFSRVVAGVRRFCGLTLDTSDLACVEDESVTLYRRGPFIDFDLSEDFRLDELCTIKESGELQCELLQDELPAGKFMRVRAGFFNVCALDVDGNVRCWWPADLGGTPRDEFPGALQLEVNMDHACVTYELPGELDCFGKNAVAPPEKFLFSSFALGAKKVCGQALLPAEEDVREGVVCIDENGWELVQPGRFASLDVDIDGSGCAVTGGTASESNPQPSADRVHCWGLASFQTPVPLRQVSLSATQLCGVDKGGQVHCFQTSRE